MKAITLTQPWASLVATGAKKIETRSWSVYYRGPLAIHAAKSFPDEAKRLCTTEPFSSELFRHGVWSPNAMSLGCIIATCELVGVDKFEEWMNEHKPVMWRYSGLFYELTDLEKEFGDFSLGRYGFFLANVKMLKNPIPARGSLGLWDWKEGG